MNIHNPEDLRDVWMDVRKGDKVLLWCDALKEDCRRKSKSSRGRVNSDTNSDDGVDYLKRKKKGKRCKT